MMIGKATVVMVALLAAASNALHYEKPPCGEDEKAVELMGIDGVFCSPACNPDCPDDPPDGVTATPSCALQSPDGSKYCAILCSPGSLEGSDCGSEMACLPVPNGGGLGVCLYPMSQGLRASSHDQMTFAETPSAVIE